MSEFATALALANAVLYEGYLLYPYTASAAKNRLRWQFGVVVPAQYAREEPSESAEQQTEVLVDGGTDAHVDVVLRFLQVEARRVEARVGSRFEPVESLAVAGRIYLTFDEAVEREVYAHVRLDPGLRSAFPISFEASRDIETLSDADGLVLGRVVRERWALRGTLNVGCQAVQGSERILKLTVQVENASAVVPGPRSEALRTSFVSTHTILVATGGTFLSALDPPEVAAEATAALKNRKTWPILVGEPAGEGRGRLVLSSPIILYDFAAVAPQTDGDAFDATEIDELLTLSVLSMPEAERAEACATDPRARAIVERAERFGPETFARVHAGTLRRTDADLADPFASIDVPGIDCVFIGGTKVSKGSAVRLRPSRRADVWDTFLAGKAATVQAVHQDLEGVFYVCVTVDDDPASDLHEWYGRSFFFYPEEIEPLVEAR